MLHNFDGADQLKADYYTDVKGIPPHRINPTADSPMICGTVAEFAGIFRLLPDRMDTNFILGGVEGNFKARHLKVCSQTRFCSPSPPPPRHPGFAHRLLFWDGKVNGLSAIPAASALRRKTGRCGQSLTSLAQTGPSGLPAIDRLPLR